jgi:hypothetical protein
MKSLHMMCLRRWRGKVDSGKSEPPATILSALKDTETVRKYLIKFDVNDNMMATLSSTENEAYRNQQKADKQQLISMVMWKKSTRLHL